MRKIGIAENIAERTLSHIIKGVAGISNRHHYFDEKFHALQRIADHVEMIVAPPERTKVVPIKPQAANA